MTMHPRNATFLFLACVALGVALATPTPLSPMCSASPSPHAGLRVRSSEGTLSKVCGAGVPMNPAQFAIFNLTYQSEFLGGPLSGTKGQNGWINVPLNQTAHWSVPDVGSYTATCPPSTSSGGSFADMSVTPFASASPHGAVLSLSMSEQLPCVPTFHFLLNGSNWYTKGSCDYFGVGQSWGTC